MIDGFADLKACVFDAYGTLFDTTSAVAPHVSALGAKAEPLTTLWRDKQVQYTWWRGLHGTHADFLRVTGDALDHALDALGLAGEVSREGLMDSFRTLRAYPEVPEVLRRARSAGLVTAVLSNGTPDMLAQATSAAEIADLIDVVLSAESVGVFKPHPAVYHLAVEKLGLGRDEILFVSSNAWDVHAASDFGFRVVWCNRNAGRPERLPGRADLEIRDLSELPAALVA